MVRLASPKQSKNGRQLAAIARISPTVGGALCLDSVAPSRGKPAPTVSDRAMAANWRPFLLCFGLASLTIASGTMNVFYAKDLPQSTLYTVLFWGNVAPGMLAGAWVVRRWGVGRALALYAGGLLVLSLGAWFSGSAPHSTDSGQGALWFALVLPLLNGIPPGCVRDYRPRPTASCGTRRKSR